MPERIQGHEQDPEFTQRFIDAVGSVNEYNEKHTGIGYAVNSMVSFFLASIKDEDDELKQPEVSDEDKAAMEKELVALLQTDELAAMGITLFDSNAPGIKEADFSESGKGEDGKPPSSLIMLITDGDKFKDALYGLKPTPEQKDLVAAGVNSLLANTVELVQAAYAFKKPEDMSEGLAEDTVKKVVNQQLDMFMELSPALVEQGFGQVGAFGKLADYAARHSAGTLADYRGAEAHGWLHETGYGPAQWPMDIGAERLHERWLEVFDFLKGLRDREEPSPYFTELFNKLRADFDASCQWLEGDDHTVSASDTTGYSASYIQPLKTEMTALAEVWGTQFPLENSFYLSEVAENQK